ncbi:V-type ATPase subunit [Clostridium thermarum]|uniref:V-type ATPase subunit n=1 Tax=Clostridium thermarum TaxID=1716543 RepID=UPI0013D03CDD|nr:V-type ATPase subunit [Clostridium thermarum]
MGSVVEFLALNTKVKALEGRLLSKEQIGELIACNSYKEALRFLKTSTKYSEALEGYNIEELHRGQLEVILKKHYIRNFTKLMHYLSEDYKKLLRIIFIRFEVEDIKIILRGKYIERENDELLNMLNFQCSLSTVDYNELLQANSVGEVVEKLRGTVYFKHIANLVKDVEKEGLFQIEMALDFVYFIMLRKFMKKLPKEDRDVIRKLNGTYADLLNIQWIFRGIKYYKLKPEILFNYTIYDGWRLKKEDIKALCYSGDLKEFYNRVNSTIYKEVFYRSNFQEYLLEKEILAYLKKIYLKYSSEFKRNISVVLAYLELALLECRDIISIVENKRYSQLGEDIIQFITATI